MPFRKAVLSLAVLLLTSVPLALAQGTYTQIDVPGALATTGTAIDSSGDIVGWYYDTNGNQNGFLFSGGTYTTIDYSGGLGTIVSGISDNGVAVGEGTPSFGFLYNVQTQAFTPLNYPGSDSTIPLAINRAGIVGGAITHGFFIVGFELIGSQYRIISPPRTTTSAVLGVTDSAMLFGGAGIRGRGFNFSFSDGKYSQFVIANAPGAVMTGVGPAAAVVGYYNPSSGVTAGFIYQNKTITTLQFPGSTFTEAFGMNAAGEVVGTFGDAEGNGHGFLWTPPADAAKK